MRADSPPLTPHHGSAGTVRVLSCHAEYRCRHAGACCTSDWPIPVEPANAAAIDAALRHGTLAATATPALTFPVGAPKDTPAVLGRAEGRCVFFRRADAGCCNIQAALGHAALPLACRQFPRVTVLDPRGVSVTLSHYCPTAAALLTPETAVTITSGADAFPSSGEYVGLDVREALPPMLRPGMLMDWPSWWEFERLSVEMLGASSSPAHALGTLRAIVDDVREWSPGDGALGDRIADAFARPTRAAPRPMVPPRTVDQLVAIVMAAVPQELRPLAGWRGHTSTAPGTSARFLAAHAFANWTAHLGGGLRAWLHSVDAASALLEAGAGVRHADLVLRHLIEPALLAKHLSLGIEGDEPRS